jgi:hypothetical protein
MNPAPGDAEETHILNIRGAVAGFIPFEALYKRAKVSDLECPLQRSPGFQRNAKEKQLDRSLRTVDPQPIRIVAIICRARDDRVVYGKESSRRPSAVESISAYGRPKRVDETI